MHVLCVCDVAASTSDAVRNSVTRLVFFRSDLPLLAVLPSGMSPCLKGFSREEIYMKCQISQFLRNNVNPKYNIFEDFGATEFEEKI